MIKVLFIAYFFPPIGGAGVQRTLKFAKYLPREGFLPVIVTCSGVSHDRWSPRDTELQREISSYIPIYRVQSLPLSQGKRIPRKLQRWFMIPNSFSKWWVNSAKKIGEKACLDNNVKLIYASMSPFESAKVAIYLSNKFHVPWIADLRDPWALDEMQVYPSYLHRKVELLKMHSSLLSTSVIIMNTPEATTSLKKTFPDLLKKEIVTITNGFDYKDFNETVLPRKDNKFRIVHSGYLHTDLGLHFLRKKRFYAIWGGALKKVDILARSHVFLLRAIERWCQHDPEIHKHVELLFVGNASKEDRLLAENSIISDIIRFTGYLPHYETVKIIRTADLLFLPMYNLPPGERSTIVPGKTYEYMASGQPILAAVPDGDARDFLTKCGTAFLSRPDDCDEMIRILSQIYEAWKKKKQIVSVNTDMLQKFDRKNLTRALAEEFDKLLLKVGNDPK
jgi:glycosyltransferase involved in cell wall biosynthesis